MVGEQRFVPSLRMRPSPRSSRGFLDACIHNSNLHSIDILVFLSTVASTVLDSGSLSVEQKIAKTDLSCPQLHHQRAENISSVYPTHKVGVGLGVAVPYLDSGVLFSILWHTTILFHDVSRDLV